MRFVRSNCWTVLAFCLRTFLLFLNPTRTNFVSRVTQRAVKEAEGARVAARHVRRTAMDAVKKIKSEISADEFKRLDKEVQTMTDKSVEAIDNALAAKVKTIDG
jgi:ribosome recycling factor